MADTRSASEKSAALKKRANAQFTAAEREASVWRTIAAERAEVDARIVKLRALRLAKEEADRIAAANAPKAPAAVKPRTRRPAAKKI